MQAGLLQDTRYNPLPSRIRVGLYPLPWEFSSLLSLAAQGGQGAGTELLPLHHAREALAEMLGIPRDAVVLTQSGTAALVLGLKALRRSEQDEVILSTFNCPNVLGAVLAAGMRPVLADIDESYNLDPESVRRLLNPRVRAVVATHVFGAPADIRSLAQLCAEAGVALVDDAAQSFGARVDGRPLSTWGELGVLSFGRHKPLFAGGGGALLLHSEAMLSERREVLAPATPSREMLRNLARLSATAACRRVWSGLPTRLGLAPAPLTDVAVAVERFQPPAQLAGMSPVTATLLLDQLPKLKTYRTRAQRYAALYVEALREGGLLQPPSEQVLSGELNFFVARCHPGARHSVASALARAGVETTWLYHPLHQVPRYARYAPSGGLPRAEAAARETLCLPCRGWHTPADIHHVIKALQRLPQEAAT